MIILNAGIFDCFHEGHQNLLRKMRLAGEKNVVVIHDDYSCYLIKGKFPIQDTKRRIWNLKMSGLVDKVYLTKSTDPAMEFEKVIKKYGADNIIYMRGDDCRDFPGKWMLERYNIPIEYVPYTKGISSTQIRNDLLK